MAFTCACGFAASKMPDLFNHMRSSGCKQFSATIGGQTRTISTAWPGPMQTSCEENECEWEVPIRGIRPLRASMDATVAEIPDDDEARTKERYSEMEREMSVVSVMKS